MPAKEVFGSRVVLVRVAPIEVIVVAGSMQLTSTDAALVVVGGVDPDLGLLADLADSASLVVAADSGAVHAAAAGCRIDIAVGDFDSIPASVLDGLIEDGVRLERHPVDKDATDLELAIDVAVREGSKRVIVIAGHGGRVDQSVANVLIIASRTYVTIEMHAVLDAALVSVVHGGGELTIEGRPGDTVTILPIHGDAEGVWTDGLEYPLVGETLPAGTTRGVSNVLSGTAARVGLDAGTVLVVRPGPEVFELDQGEVT